MRLIPLTQGKFAQVDDGDYDFLSQWNWTAMEHKSTWYAVRQRPRPEGPRRLIYMHRVILGITDRQIVTDHRDHDGLNNQRDNLRACSIAQNGQNQRKQRRTKSSMYKGVQRINHPQYVSERWLVDIKVGDERLYLGHFKTELEAALAYDEAARKHFGEFAHVNFPVIPAPQ